jgi:hypothetical protein
MRDWTAEELDAPRAVSGPVASGDATGPDTLRLIPR